MDVSTQQQSSINPAHKRNRGGRPPLPDDERRCIRVQPAFTLSEFDIIEEKAKALGIDVSEWLRMSSLGDTIKQVPSINRIAYSDLSRLAANLNQLAARANSTNILNADAVITAANSALEMTQKLRLELIGKGDAQ